MVDLRDVRTFSVHAGEWLVIEVRHDVRGARAAGLDVTG